MGTISNINVGRSITTAKLDNIQFNNISHSDGQGLKTKWNRLDGPWKSSSSSNLSIFGVNAVDIDWNDAQFANAVAAITEVPDAGEVQSANSSITTTGELISIVAKQQKQIDALITMVKGLYASLVS